MVIEPSIFFMGKVAMRQKRSPLEIRPGNRIDHGKVFPSKEQSGHGNCLGAGG